MSEGFIQIDVGDHPLQPFPSPTLWHIISNYTVPHRSTETLYLKRSNLEAEDLNLSQRLMASYWKMRDYEEAHMAPESIPNSGIWEMTKHEFHGPFYKLMVEKDCAGLAAYMSNAMRETLTHGLGPGKLVFDAMNAPGEGQRANVLIIIDRLASLAEAVGALRHENPEQGPYGGNTTLSATDLVDRVERAIGAKIGRPGVMGNFGIAVNEEIVDVRVPDDAYTMFRAKQIADTFGLNKIAEIGGGIGGNALQAFRMGFSSYKIFDIPVVAIVQGWFLSKTLGGDHVRLYGETHNGQFLDLLPYWEFANRTIDFDFVINRDSLPEIPAEHAVGYLAEIAERKGYLLSINQESCAGAGQGNLVQNCVLDLVRQTGGLSLASRHRAWTRKGYVEELFAPI